MWLCEVLQVLDVKSTMYRNISGLGLVVGAVMNRHGVVGSLEVTVRLIQSCSVSIYIYLYIYIYSHEHNNITISSNI